MKIKLNQSALDALGDQIAQRAEDAVDRGIAAAKGQPLAEAEWGQLPKNSPKLDSNPSATESGPSFSNSAGKSSRRGTLLDAIFCRTSGVPAGTS